MTATTTIQESKVFWDRASNTLYVWDPNTKGWTSLAGLLSGGMVTTEQLTSALLLKLDKTGGPITGDLTISGKLGVGGATPDATNPVAMQTPSVFLTNPSGTLNLTVNKGAAANDARFTFQTGYSTRALFGLLGDDNFAIKVSPDGSSFYQAINIDRSTGHVGVCTSADATNALSVAGPSALFTNGAGSFRFVFSKHASTDDAALTFQTNYSARALIGLLGNDDFTFKVTPDGASFFTSFVISKDSGKVSFEQLLGAKRSYPSIASNAITATSSYANIGNAGTINTINGGFDGAVLIVQNTSGGTVTITNAGNVKTPGGTSLVLDSWNDMAIFVCNGGGTWLCAAFSNN